MTIEEEKFDKDDDTWKKSDLNNLNMTWLRTGLVKYEEILEFIGTE